MSRKAKIPRRPVVVPEPQAPQKRVCQKLWFWMVLVVALAVVALAVWLLVIRPAVKSAPQSPVIVANVEVSADLDVCVRDALLAEHYSDHTESKYPAVAYTPLFVQEGEDTVTVYGVMMYREYTATTKNELEVWGAAQSPFALTAKKTDEGYSAVECWWPESGANYRSSIEDKFPEHCRENAIQSQQYYTVHDTACKAAAESNIADADKYVVLQSEKENVRLAYCPNNDGAYVIFVAGYNSDGTYAPEGEDKMVFTFDERKVVFTIDGDTYVYNEAESANLPDEWKGTGDTAYFVDGVVFEFESDAPSVPETPKDTAPVGSTVTAASSTWMSEEELREMFGEYVPQSFDYAVSDNHYLPVRPIETRAQLERFLTAYADGWTNLQAENFAQYDEAFFEDNYLILTYYRNGMDSCEPEISEYVYVQDGTSLWLSVRLEVAQPAEGDAVVGQWLLFSGIAKTDYKKATGLEAYVEKTVTKDTSSADLTLTGTVKEVDGGAMLLECEGDSQFTTVWVELGEAELDPMVGETYAVTYEDIVMPSLPPRITAVTITKP